MIQTFYLDAATGQRLQSPDYAVAATDTPTGKLMSTEPVRIQYLNVAGQKGTPVAAPSSTIKFGLKQGTVALGNYSDTTFDVYTDAFTAPADPTQPGAFYTASLTIDSTALRALFPVATNGTSPGTVNLIGEILSGAVPSATFAFQAQNNLIKGTESPAVDIPGPSGYPTPAALAASIAAASLDTSAAVLQPPGVSLAYAHRLALVNPSPSGITLDLSGKGLTSIAPSEVLAWIISAANIVYGNYGNVPINVLLNGNALTNVEAILDTIAAGISGGQLYGTNWYGVLNIDVSGGTNAVPPVNVAHQDASVSLQLPEPVPDNAGLVYSVTLNAGSANTFLYVVNYDATIPLSGSSFAYSNYMNISYTATVGVQDSPAMVDVVTRINTLFGGSPVAYFPGPSNLNPDGSFTGADTSEADYPVAFAGPAILSSSPGVVAFTNASLAAIQALNGGQGEVETN